mgnify:CR=1 FL=1
MLDRLRMDDCLLEDEARAALGEGSDAPVALPVAVNADSLATWFAPVLGAAAGWEGTRLQLEVEDEEYSADHLRRGAVVGAVTSYIALANDALQSLGVWFAGSFTSVLRGQYEVLWIVALVAIAIFVVADRFTVAGLGEEISTNVGLNYNQVVLIGTVLVAVATGVVTVVVGNLPFLGLIVPNIISMWRGDDLRSNLPWVCLLGVAIVTVCDLLARTLIAPFELPVSVILGVVGAAVFIALIVKRSRNA